MLLVPITHLLNVKRGRLTRYTEHRWVANRSGSVLLGKFFHFHYLYDQKDYFTVCNTLRWRPYRHPQLTCFVTKRDHASFNTHISFVLCHSQSNSTLLQKYSTFQTRSCHDYCWYPTMTHSLNSVPLPRPVHSTYRYSWPDATSLRCDWNVFPTRSSRRQNFLWSSLFPIFGRTH